MAKTKPAWRVEELAALAAEVADVAGSSRRVRWTPDIRTLRYYTTLGLLSRPRFFKGRVAYYGRKHLAQVVAIKRLQAQGLTLAEIQAHLAGLPESELFALAALPERLPEATTPAPRSREAFWTSQPKRPTKTCQPAPSRRAGLFVEVAPGVVLLVEGVRHTLTPDELSQLRQAAGPLLARLAVLDEGKEDQ